MSTSNNYIRASLEFGKEIVLARNTLCEVASTLRSTYINFLQQTSKNQNNLDNDCTKYLVNVPNNFQPMNEPVFEFYTDASEVFCCLYKIRYIHKHKHQWTLLNTPKCRQHLSNCFRVSSAWAEKRTIKPGSRFCNQTKGKKTDKKQQNSIRSFLSLKVCLSWFL